MEFPFDISYLSGSPVNVHPANGIAAGILGGSRVSSTSDWPSTASAAVPSSLLIACVTHQSIELGVPRHRQCTTLLLDKLGEASAVAQGLRGSITSASKLSVAPEQTLLVAYEGRIALGFIKFGPKTLFVTSSSSSSVFSASGGGGPRMHEIRPVCILDFFVVGNRRRQGIGQALVQAAVGASGLPAPRCFAWDRPSPMCLSFLSKHYGLRSYTPQANNYVVFDDYWREREEALAATQTTRQMFGLGGSGIGGGGPSGAFTPAGLATLGRHTGGLASSLPASTMPRVGNAALTATAGGAWGTQGMSSTVRTGVYQPENRAYGGVDPSATVGLATAGKPNPPFPSDLVERAGRGLPGAWEEMGWSSSIRAAGGFALGELPTLPSSSLVTAASSTGSALSSQEEDTREIVSGRTSGLSSPPSRRIAAAGATALMGSSSSSVNAAYASIQRGTASLGAWSGITNDGRSLSGPMGMVVPGAASISNDASIPSHLRSSARFVTSPRFSPTQPFATHTQAFRNGTAAPDAGLALSSSSSSSSPMPQPYGPPASSSSSWASAATSLFPPHQGDAFEPGGRTRRGHFAAQNFSSSSSSNSGTATSPPLGNSAAATSSNPNFPPSSGAPGLIGTFALGDTAAKQGSSAPWYPGSGVSPPPQPGLRSPYSRFAHSHVDVSVPQSLPGFAAREASSHFSHYLAPSAALVQQATASAALLQGPTSPVHPSAAFYSTVPPPGVAQGYTDEAVVLPAAYTRVSLRGGAEGGSAQHPLLPTFSTSTKPFETMMMTNTAATTTYRPYVPGSNPAARSSNDYTGPGGTTRDRLNLNARNGAWPY